MLVFVVAGLLFFAGLGHFPLFEPDEGRNAEVAREMIELDDWITPHYNGLTYLDKPALFFWMVATSFKALGFTAAAARLPSALMALGTVFLAWLWARRVGVGRVNAALILASTPFMIAFSRIVIFDMTLTFLVSLSLLGFWGLEKSEFQKVRFSLLFFGSMGLAAITKGPVGFLLPLLTVIAYLGLSGRWRDLRRLRWGPGLLAFLATALPWFLAASLQNPDFPRYAFLDESLLRFTTGSARRGGPLYYYLPVFLLGFLPWSLFLLTGYLGRWRAWRRLRDPENRALLFVVCWAAVVLVFFTISRSKLPGYILPAFTPLSLLGARLWDRWPGAEGGAPPPRWLTRGFWALLGLGLLIFLSSWGLQLGLGPSQERLIEKMGPRVASELSPTLFFWGIMLVGISVLGRHASWRRHGPGVTLALLVLAVPLVIVRGYRPLRAHLAAQSSEELAEKILSSEMAESPLYAYHCYRPSLGFYLGRPVNLVTSDASELGSNYISPRVKQLLEEPKTTIFSPEHLVRVAETNSRRVLVLTLNANLSSLIDTIPRAEPLWQDWKYSVWVIPPANPAQAAGSDAPPDN